MNRFETDYVRGVESRTWLHNEDAYPLCSEVGTIAFFPPDEDEPQQNWWNGDPQKICLNCELINECAAYAILTRQEYGIWGGFSPSHVLKMNTEYTSTPIGIQFLVERETTALRNRLNRKQAQ